jgi:hypothetical protein
MPKAKSKAPSKATVEQDTSKDEQLAMILGGERSIRVRKQSPNGASSTTGNATAKAATVNNKNARGFDNVINDDACDDESMEGVSATVASSASALPVGPKARHVAQFDSDAVQQKKDKIEATNKKIPKPQQQKAGKTAPNKTITKTEAKKKIAQVPSFRARSTCVPFPLCALFHFPDLCAVSVAHCFDCVLACSTPQCRFPDSCCIVAGRDRDSICRSHCDAGR